MAATLFHKPTGRYLTYCFDWREGTVVTLSIGSYSKTRTYLSGKSMWCEFTQYTLVAPVAFDELSGRPLFDLNECNPVCALDVSPLRAEAA
jgi:hypothetical protein